MSLGGGWGYFFRVAIVLNNTGVSWGRSYLIALGLTPVFFCLPRFWHDKPVLT